MNRRGFVRGVIGALIGAPILAKANAPKKGVGYPTLPHGGNEGHVLAVNTDTHKLEWVNGASLMDKHVTHGVATVLTDD